MQYWERDSSSVQHIARKAHSLYAELKLPRKLPRRLKSGCREWSVTAPGGLVLTSFFLYQFFHQICVWVVSCTHPGKCWKQGWSLCTSADFACEVITEFMELFLNRGHAHDVRKTGRFSAGGGNYRQLARQSNWLVALFLNHLLSCVDRAVLAWKRFFFFYSHPARSLHHFTFWVIHVIVKHASDLLKNGCFAFSVIETDSLPYFSHFAAGSPLKTHGTSHLLSACDMPSRATFRGDGSGLWSPRTGQCRAPWADAKAGFGWGAPVFPERERAALAASGNRTE